MEELKPVEHNAEPAEPAVDAAPALDAAAQLEALAAERDQLAREKEELQDRLLRRQADFENFRRRVERERSEMAAYAEMETIRALLPVVDDFERALKVECADREYARGMELICQRLLETLAKLGVEPVPAAGRPFDPNIHHALKMVETDEVEDHTVIEEYQRGYNFKGRLLRPAMVTVAVKPKNGDE